MPVRNSHDDVTGLEVFLLSNRGEVVLWDEVSRQVFGGSDTRTFGPHHVVLLLWSQELGSRGEVHHHYSQRLSSGGRPIDDARTKEGENSNASGRTSLENLTLVR